MSEKKLTNKQEQFCREYVVDLNATQAAIRAGYSLKTAGAIGRENLRKPTISQRIKELLKPKQEKPLELREQVLNELRTIAFTNVDEFMETVKDPENGQSYQRIKPEFLDSPKLAAIAGVEPTRFGYKLKINDKQRALEMLSRHLGLFNADTSQKPEQNQFDFTNISSEKLRKIKEILSEDE